MRLIDFDMDGTEELLLCYAGSKVAQPTYYYAVWTSKDGKTAVQLCENEIYPGGQSYCPYITIAQNADGYSLYELTSYEDSRSCTVVNGEWVTSTEFRAVEDMPDFYCYIDGAEVSEEDYFAATEKAQTGEIDTEVINFTAIADNLSYDDGLVETSHKTVEVKAIILNDPEYFTSTSTTGEAGSFANQAFISTVYSYESGSIYEDSDYELNYDTDTIEDLQLTVAYSLHGADYDWNDFANALVEESNAHVNQALN